MVEIKGGLDGAGLKIGIVRCRFNEPIGRVELEACLGRLGELGVAGSDIAVVAVAGALEAPLTLQRLAATGKYDALVALGAVIRGATPHFDLVASQCAAGLARAADETGIPVAFGVLTTDTIEQAVERAGTKAGNKGADAALCALELANLLRRLDV